MDGYFVAPPQIVQLSRHHVPVATPYGDSYSVNRSVLMNFWSVRDLWLEERWSPQSEATIAVSVARAQPAYVPTESWMTPVVMVSW